MSLYPRDLLIPIREHVAKIKADKKYEWRGAFPLPDDAVLSSLLESAYHASFKTEEGRRPGFRIIFAQADELKSHRHPAHDIENRRLITFTEPRPFLSSEIVRIAPAADLSRFLICVQNSSRDENSGLEIWGLLDVGENWLQFIQHEASSGTPPPNHLTITSVAPGELSLSAAGDIFLVLKDGSLLQPSGHALWSGPIAKHLSGARNSLYKAVVERLDAKRFDEEGSDDDYPRRFYTFFLERILHNVRAKAHGGTVLVVPDYLTPSDTRLVDRATVKYPCLYDHAWELLVASLVNHRQFYDLHFPLSDGECELNTDNFHRYNSLSDQAEEIEASLRDIARSIASLTAVDGAVVLTTHFRVFGFGAEVICPSPSLNVVKVANSDALVPISSFGTRHRAAFRFCSTYDDAIAFVVSQDGAVKAVKRVGPDVLLWPDINSGILGL